jgi:hypothetical protein
MEDLLTSDAFGTMYYLGWHEGFRNWLLEAQPAGGTTVTVRDFLGCSPIQKALFAFWPLLPNGKEADLALLLISADGSLRLLIVEVKYGSGPSDFEIDTSADTATDKTGSQLVDQMVGFANVADCRPLLKKWFKDCTEPVPARLRYGHLFVTTDLAFPHELYDEAAKRLPLAGLTAFPCPAFWLSWKRLLRNLKPYTQTEDSATSRLITDLVRLLERKNLAQFEGFGNLTWSGLSPDKGFWRQSRFFDFAPALEIIEVLESGCLLSAFWQTPSLFTTTAYPALSLTDTLGESAHVFWKGAYMIDGATISKGIQFVDTIYKDISRLIETMDGLVKRMGYKSLWGSGCYWSSSQKSDNPDGWLPHVLVRLYVPRAEDDKTFSTFLFFYIYLRPKHQDEPLAVWGIAKRIPGKDIGPLCGITLLQTEGPDFLRRKEIEPFETSREYADVLKTFRYAVKPLIELNSEEQVERVVIRPLLKEIGQAPSPNAA